MLFNITCVNYLCKKKSIWSKRPGRKYEQQIHSNLEVISFWWCEDSLPGQKEVSGGSWHSFKWGLNLWKIYVQAGPCHFPLCPERHPQIPHCPQTTQNFFAFLYQLLEPKLQGPPSKAVILPQWLEGWSWSLLKMQASESGSVGLGSGPCHIREHLTLLRAVITICEMQT